MKFKIIGLSLALIGVLLFIDCLNIQTETNTFEVISKFEEDRSRYKSRKIYTQSILILKNKEGELIDLDVSFSTFYKAKVGEYMSFNLKPEKSKIESEIWRMNNNGMYAFISFILFCGGICLVVLKFV